MATALSGYEYRITMLGGSDADQMILGSLIAGNEDVSTPPRHPRVWKRRPFLCVKTPDINHLPVDKGKLEIQKCVSLCNPGPNLLFILVNPCAFKEPHMARLRYYLECFGRDAFKLSMVIITGRTERPWHSAINKLIQECNDRHYTVILDDPHFSEFDLDELRGMVASIVSFNSGRYLKFTGRSDPVENIWFKKPVSNLVLCGRSKANKASVAQAILGREVDQPADSLICIRNQQVFGQLVTVVELPHIHGKSPDVAKKEAHNCISLCHPEGAHAFLLVIALENLLEDDKQEFEALRNAFGHQVENLIIPLITVKSDLTTNGRMFLNENSLYQMIRQRCRGRYVILNTRSREQVAEVLRTVEKMRAGSPLGFTKHMFQTAAQPTFLRRFSSLRGSKTMGYHSRCSLRISSKEEDFPSSRQRRSSHSTLNSPHNEGCSSANEIQCCRNSCRPSETQTDGNWLRIGLVGKTGSGKSATANTILGSEVFKTKGAFGSVTASCQKAQTDIDGRQVVVVDTPGLFDTHFPKEKINTEIIKCVDYLHPGPHAFLVVLQIGRMTDEEQATLQLLNCIFGERALTFSIVVFTRGDELGNQTIEDCIEEEKSGFLKKVIGECGGRYHVMNNKDMQNRAQVLELLNKVELMVDQNGGKCYKTEVYNEEEEAQRGETENTLEIVRDLEIQFNKEMEFKKESLMEIMKKMEEENEESGQKLLEMRNSIQRELEQILDNREKRDAENRLIREQEEIQRQMAEQRMEARLMQLQTCEAEAVTGGRVMSLIQTKEELRRKQDYWERERRKWWEKQHQADTRDEEQTVNLTEKYQQELQRYEAKRQEDIIKKENVAKELRETEASYNKQIAQIRRRYEDGARKEADECYKFRQRYDQDVRKEKAKYKKEMNDLKQTQQRQNEFLVKQLCRNKSFEKDFDRLKSRQEEEINQFERQRHSQNLQDINSHIVELQKKHDEDIHAWIIDHMIRATNGRCSIL